MKCHRHHERDAVGVCVACGQGLCADTCAHDGDPGLYCDEACARRLHARERKGASAPVAWQAAEILFSGPEIAVFPSATGVCRTSYQ